MCMFFVRFTKRLWVGFLFLFFGPLFHYFPLDYLLLMSPVQPFHFCPCICGLTLSCPSASVISPSSECVIRISVCCLFVCGRCCAKPLLWVMKACAIYSGQGGRERRWDVLYRHDCKDDLWRSQMYNKICQKIVTLCVCYRLVNFLFSQVNAFLEVEKFLWLCWK